MYLGYESHLFDPNHDKSHSFSSNCIKKITFKWNSLRIGLHKGHASRATVMTLGSERHLFNSNYINFLLFKWRCPKVWLHKGHASRITPMSLGSKRHLMEFLHVLETTFLDLGGPLAKPMNMCCCIEYADLNPSFEHNL
jgi:hypothetical protein